jgi:hypothetical protein
VRDDLWVIKNPSLNATSCAHPRPDVSKGRTDLSLGEYGYVIVTSEELDVWRLSPAFLHLEQLKLVVVEKYDGKPFVLPTIPPDVDADSPFDRYIAREIALAPEEMDETQMLRIRVMQDTGKSGRIWTDDADIAYLKTRHRKLLTAARWYMENYPNPPNKAGRLKAVRQTLALIDQLG